eukprot:706560-Pelagomonas_calceolata.AAC.4
MNMMQVCARRVQQSTNEQDSSSFTAPPTGSVKLYCAVHDSGACRASAHNPSRREGFTWGFSAWALLLLLLLLLKLGGLGHGVDAADDKA